MKPSKMSALLALAALTTGPATAESFRCGNDLANTGDSRASVHAKCGEPAYKDSFCKPSGLASVQNIPPGGTVVNVMPCENLDEWTYNPGTGQFMTTLRFESGKLVSISYGDRVK